MQITTGIDIIEVDRIKSAVQELGDTFLNKIYTMSEIEYCNKSKGDIKYQHLAARFAAKEAVFKALSENIDCGNVTIETCPQYLLLDKTAGMDAKVNPALHTKTDNEALWEGIRSGIVKTIGTDNVPVTRAQKYTRNERQMQYVNQINSFKKLFL